MHDKSHSYDRSLGIIILMLCIHFSLLHYLSTSEFIWTTDLWDRDSLSSQKINCHTYKQSDFPSVPGNVCLVSWGKWSFPSILHLQDHFWSSAHPVWGFPVQGRCGHTEANWVQWRVSRAVMCLEHMVCEERLGDLELFSQEKRRWRRVLRGGYRYVLGGCREDGLRFFVQVPSDRIRDSAHKIENGKFSSDIM